MHRPKSIGHEHTFNHDVTSRATLDTTLLELADGVAVRLREAGLAAGTVQLKLRTEGFQTLTRQAPLDHQAREAEPLYAAARSLLDTVVTSERAVRLIGLTAIDLSEDQQLTLFDTGAEPERIARSMDAVRARFGPAAITRARLLEGAPRRRFDVGERPSAPDPGHDPGDTR